MVASEDWPRLLELVEQALDVPVDERKCWLADLVLGEGLRGALIGLLGERQAIEDSNFLAAIPEIEIAAADGLAPGALIGPWRLVREIGRGGMSTVWLADRVDDQLTRQVALKLPHAGPGQGLLARRLLRERKILAALEHPHIARLYDVGTTATGMPYLVMEYVRGQTLLAHADAKRLAVSDRLLLFMQVLRAVQHAHGKMVLHRDLKPSNILVDDLGQAKLLDFGIARLLVEAEEGDMALTQEGGPILTPEYAAPEQLTAQAPGIGCDIYALGVVLFELLTGERPYVLAASMSARAALEAAIVTAEPRRPSDVWKGRRDASGFSSTAIAIRRALRGDLDIIVSKALRKNPQDRYSSAAAFCSDIQRYLDRRPIRARRPSLLYRFGKLLRRNYRQVSVGAALVCALTIGMMSSWSWMHQGTESFNLGGWNSVGPSQTPGNCSALRGNDWLRPRAFSVQCLQRPNSFFGALHRFPLDDSFLGRLAVLHVELRLMQPNVSGAPWLRVDSPRAMFALDNFHGAQLQPTTDWQTVSVQVPIPSDADALVGGVMLYTAGQIQVRRLEIESVPRGSLVVPRVFYLDKVHPETPPGVPASQLSDDDESP